MRRLVCLVLSLAMLTAYGQEETVETAITGGLTVRNETDYYVDSSGLAADGPDITLPASAAQILIIHTHSSEAYLQAGADRYTPSDTCRTESTEYNVVRIGDELTAVFKDWGLNVIHDRGIYDYPSDTGAYSRSGEAISRYLEQYPGIGIVFDIHRESVGSDGVVYKTMAEGDGLCAAQLMLIVGTDQSGLEHPHWQENLSLALYLQKAADTSNPTLMRPVSLVRQRYNQQLSPGMLILEVGSDGNTLQEALCGVRLFGNAVAPALLELTE